MIYLASSCEGCWLSHVFHLCPYPWKIYSCLAGLMVMGHLLLNHQCRSWSNPTSAFFDVHLQMTSRRDASYTSSTQNTALGYQGLFVETRLEHLPCSVWNFFSNWRNTQFQSKALYMTFLFNGQIQNLLAFGDRKEWTTSVGVGTTTFPGLLATHILLSGIALLLSRKMK